MAISCWDRFTAIEWTKHADRLALVSIVVLIVMAVITWFTYSSYKDKYNNSKEAVIGVSVYCVFIAFLMLIVETPILNCLGAIKRY